MQAVTRSDTRPRAQPRRTCRALPADVCTVTAAGGVALLDVPGPLADDADLALQRTELPLLDAGPRTAPGVTRHDVAHVRR